MRGYTSCSYDFNNCNFPILDVYYFTFRREMWLTEYEILFMRNSHIYLWLSSLQTATDTWSETEKIVILHVASPYMEYIHVYWLLSEA